MEKRKESEDEKQISADASCALADWQQDKSIAENAHNSQETVMAKGEAAYGLLWPSHAM